MADAAARSAGEPLWAGGKSFGGRMASMAVAGGAMFIRSDTHLYRIENQTGSNFRE